MDGFHCLAGCDCAFVCFELRPQSMRFRVQCRDACSGHGTTGGYIYNLGQRNGFLGKFYAPLYWAYNETPLHKPLGMYMHLWVPIAFKKNGETNN